jgi:maltose alpha-D-glucosyltransferase/alpha-amylase
MNLLAQERCVADAGGRHTIELEPYGYRWLRVGDMERPIAEERRAQHQR